MARDYETSHNYRNS